MSMQAVKPTARSRLSIVAINLNYAQYLECMIRSVIDQKYPDLEFIMMDGGSTDGSVDIIKKYESHFAYWQSKPDGGPGNGAMEGFSRATGDICGWIMSDDWFCEGAFEAVASFFTAHPEAQWCVGQSHFVNESGKVWKTDRADRLDVYAFCHWPEHAVPAPSVFWRRGLYENVGGVHTDLTFADDFDLWLRFAEKTSGVPIDVPLAFTRCHPRQRAQNNLPRYRVEVGLSLYRNGYREDAVRVLLEQSNLWRRQYWRLAKTFPVNILLWIWRKIHGTPIPPEPDDL